MNGTHILELFSNQLADEIAGRDGDCPRFAPLNISPWLAMSLMQKAIRRGREELALGAAATLLKVSPDRLWRRLCVTVYEDIGVADFDLVALVTVAVKGKTFRAGLGGEWAVASHLIELMCRSAKCRAADDLAVVCEQREDLERARLDLTFRALPDLVGRIAGEGDIGERALALWYATGTDRCPSPVLRSRRGDPQAAFNALCDAGFAESVVEVCREGFRKCNEILPPFLILLEQEVRNAERQVEPDDLPAEVMIGDLPCWAYDMHVREGNRALAKFIEGDSPFAHWFRKTVGKARGSKPAGNLLFRVESGLVDRRLKWSTGKRLRDQADVRSCGLDPKLAAEGLELLQADLPKLNEARRHVTASNFR